MRSCLFGCEWTGKESGGHAVALSTRLWAHELPPLLCLQLSPFPGGQGSQREPPNPNSDQPQSRMPNGSGHTPHLAFLPFHQLQCDPSRRHGFAEADRRLARRHDRLRLQQARLAGQGRSRLDDNALGEAAQGLRRILRSLRFPYGAPPRWGQRAVVGWEWSLLAGSPRDARRVDGKRQIH